MYTLGRWTTFEGPGQIQAIRTKVILANGAVIDDATPENLHAFVDTGKKYGVYR